MILTRLEKEKLDSLKEQIVRGFRKRVLPRFYRADGSSQPIEAAARPIGMRAITKMDRMKLIAQARGIVRIDQYRGITFIGLVLDMIREVAAGSGIPQSMMEELVEAQRERALSAGVRADYGTRQMLERGPCQCANCLLERGDITMAGAGNSTVPRRTIILGDRDTRLTMLPDVQLNGPLRRPSRREAKLGAYGSVMDTEPGQDRTYRKPGNEFLMAAAEQAERNREMQYDERDYEI